MSRLVIGLCGHKGSGKDTAAAALVSMGFSHLKFINACKLMIGQLLATRGAEPETIQRMIEGDLKEVPSPMLGGRTPRYAMQTLGTEWGRTLIHEELWTAAAFDRARLITGHVVFSDVRFQDEAEVIKELGGEVWRIVRPGFHGDGHASETGVEAIRPDRTILNDGRSAVGFRHEIEALWCRLYAPRFGDDKTPLSWP